MTQTATKAQPIARAPKPTLKVGGKPPPAAAAASPPPAPPTIVPSSPRLFPLVQLARAPENVRHIRRDEGVEEIKASIAAHGLLQSLIGYERDGKVLIVGGGRRFQALWSHWEDGTIDGKTFTVPVLIRDVDDAIELSLAENLEQRTMSPVDEFRAFRALMDRGDTSPARLAARFGFSERVVKQRLRLADLAPEILDALAERTITIDAAMAYASSQDQVLQAEVFKVQARRTWEPHAPRKIRDDIQSKGMRTTDPIFRFVTAEIYERDGGGYEDDLFVEGAGATATGRVLDRPFIVEAAARRMIDFQAIRVIEELKRGDKYAPTIVGHVAPDNMRLFSYGTSEKLVAPKGFVEVDERYGDADKAWKTIRNNGIEVHVVVGIDDGGKLSAWPKRFFVPKEQKGAVGRQPVAANNAYREKTPAERAEEARLQGVTTWARRLAIGPFAGTPLDGRAFWPEPYDDRPRAVVRDGVSGWMVSVQVFVTDTAIAAQRPAAERHYDESQAARVAAEQAREQSCRQLADRGAQLLALDPPPAVVLVDERAFYRWDDGGYWDEPEDIDGENDQPPVDDGADNLAQLLANATSIGGHWPTIDAWRADRAASAGTRTDAVTS